MIDPLGRGQFMEQMVKSETVGEYSESTVERFYEWMYPRDNSIVQVAAFPVPTEGKSKDDMGEGKWIHTRTLNQFKDFCETHSGLWRYHVYAGVNPLDVRPDYGRGCVEDIGKVYRLSFDIETDKESYQGASKEEVWWSYKYALAQVKYMLEEYSVVPMIVMSENGIHLHYRVNFDCNEDKLVGRQHIYSKHITQQAMNSKYAKQIKDQAPPHITFDQDDVSDPPRIMKVPGTKGIKSRQGRLCGIIHEPEYSDAGIIMGDDVDVESSDFESDKMDMDSYEDATLDIDVSMDELSNELKEKIIRYCKNDDKFRKYWEADVKGYKTNSEAEFAFIIKMLNHGFSEEETIQTMWKSGMKKWNNEGENYRERTVARAIEYFDGEVKKDSKDGSFSFSSQS